MAERIMDADDMIVFRQGLILSESVRVFLVRRQTQKVIAAGVLDEDAVADLVKQSSEMLRLRTRRTENARARSEEPSSPAMRGPDRMRFIAGAILAGHPNEHRRQGDISEAASLLLEAAARMEATGD